ncbi:MAG: class I tRNA ligase family protein, partial [Alphaproteobacteria bacterium]
MKFPPLPAPVSLPEIDREITAFWTEDKTFEASVEQRPETNEFVFYDGPPFANGLPHYGHLLTGYVKDIIPRFQTMAGNRVERRFGWDTHGLPAELSAEEEIGVSGRKAIIELGVDKFNEACRQSVLRYTADWEKYVTRQARWVDFENSYKTLDLDYMETCLWAFKQLYDRGLVYKDYRVVPYSWAMESPLSNFETRLDNSYRMRADPAVTVVFPLTAPDEDGTPVSLLIWTTTPWTLPSNLAVAVGVEIDYAVMDLGGKRVILAESARERYAKQLEGAELARTVKGSELLGKTYTPPFPYFAGNENAFRVLEGDFVGEEDGTGLVHMAPGFGEDDLKVCRANGIGVVVPVDEAGRFMEPVS